LALGLRATASDPALHRSPVARRFSPRLAGMIAAALLIAVIGASVYLLTKGGNPSEVGTPGKEAKAVEALAVLPFVNDGGNPETEYLSDGIPDTIIHSLSRLRQRDLKVRPFTSVARYKGREPDLREVARDLDVGAVVTGRVRLRGDNLFVSVALVDTQQDSELWGHTYDRKLNDILALQDEIAKEIAANLRLRLSAEEERRLTKRDTQNPEAFQLYVKGRYFWNKWTPEQINKARSYFEQAIEKDPSYALAYAGLSDCYAVPANPLPPREKMPKARAAAMKALELDDTLAEVHTTLARVLMTYDWNWSGAKKEFELAIELNSRYAMAHQWYAAYWQAMGRSDKSIGERKRALELDPLSVFMNFGLALSFYHAGQYDQAIEQFKKTLEMDENFPPPHSVRSGL
jgi:TolB-like protein/Tfp pilus assembly protein PilF